MGKKWFPVLVLLFFAALLQSGCSSAGQKGQGVVDGPKMATEEKNPAATEESIPDPVMDQFAALGKNAGAADIMAFLNKNIKAVSKENASKIVCRLEEAQKADLPKLDDKFNNGDMQERIAKVYSPGFDLSNIEGIKDGALKSLLAEARAGGYKVETAEGMYFPIIDYGTYRKFSSQVTSDIKDYIDIMALESDRVPARDGSLVIGWGEVIKRALTQEKFMAAHRNSPRYNDVKQLYGIYADYAFFGIDNTPLFGVDDKTMVPQARAAYLEAVQNGGSDSFNKALKDFLGLLEKSDYKLTGEVDQFRKNAAASLKK